MIFFIEQKKTGKHAKKKKVNRKGEKKRKKRLKPGKGSPQRIVSTG